MFYFLCTVLTLGGHARAAPKHHHTHHIWVHRCDEHDERVSQAVTPGSGRSHAHIMRQMQGREAHLTALSQSFERVTTAGVGRGQACPLF